MLSSVVSGSVLSYGAAAHWKRLASLYSVLSFFGTAAASIPNFDIFTGIFDYDYYSFLDYCV